MPSGAVVPSRDGTCMVNCSERKMDFVRPEADTPTMLSRRAQAHAAGAILVIGLALVLEAMIMGGGFVNPGARAAVFLGGLLVTFALLMGDVRSLMLAAYAAAFFISFALFALLGF